MLQWLHSLIITLSTSHRTLSMGMTDIARMFFFGGRGERVGCCLVREGGLLRGNLPKQRVANRRKGNIHPTFQIPSFPSILFQHDPSVQIFLWVGRRAKLQIREKDRP